MSVWKTFTNQKQWEEYLKQLLKTNDRALFRATLLVYNNQTQDEQKSMLSLEANKVGFSKSDAYILSEIAEKLKSGMRLSNLERSILRMRMPKYWKQLMIASKEKESKMREAKIVNQCPCDYGICDECEECYGQLRLEY